MKTIIFCPTGEAVSDFRINEKLDEFLQNDRTTWFIANGIVLDEVRARIHEGEIDNDAILVRVKDLKGDLHNFTIDGNGRSQDWVDSLEIHSNIYSRLLTFKNK